MADNLSKDTTERDLWDLDDLMIGDPDGPPQASIKPIRRNRVPAAPEPKTAAAKPADAKGAPGVPVVGGRSSVVRRITRNDRGRNPLANPQAAGQGDPEGRPVVPKVDRVETTFDELEHWDESAGVATAQPIEDVFDELSEGVKPAAPDEVEAGEETSLPTEEQVGADIGTAEAGGGTVATGLDGNEDEFAPKATTTAERIELRPKLALNLLEKIGLACLLVLLVGGGVWAYRNTVSKIDGGESTPVTGLPVTGSHVTIRKIESYWRAPVGSGDKREIVRRGVVLIPVVELTVSGKGAVRVLFRDDKGTDVGDPVVREVNGDTTLEIPATVGFEDLSAHAAYQAGLTKPWQVRIADGPSTAAAGSDFKDLAKSRISPNLR